MKQITLLDYIHPNLVTFLNAATRDEALRLLTNTLNEKGKLKDQEIFHDVIMQRERIVSTGIGMGVAIPHAKLEGYDDFFVALGIQPEMGIEWDAIDGAPVRLIFMIGGPEERQAEYLGILSQLTLIIKDEKLRSRLLKAKKPEEVMQLFESSIAPAQ